MPKVHIWTFAISAEAAEKTFTGFVDMLRYDQAIVIECSNSIIVMQTRNHAPTEGRWASLRLHILAQVQDDDVWSVRKAAAAKLTT